MQQSTRRHRSTISNSFLGQSAYRDRAVLLIGQTIACLVIGCFTLASFVAVLFPDRALSAVPTPVLVVPSPSLPTVKPESVAPLPVAKRILGQWLAKEPLEGDTIMFVFAPDGKAFIVSGAAASGNAIATQFQYRLDAKPQPMHLDIVLTPDTTVETLFEFTTNGDLRLQMLGTRPGKPRPVKLTDHATLFQKISDDTTPPSGTEIKPFR
ncbi:MAG: hypothetical protein KME42_25540 [Tildeniella nuda ZEHNDER 1965/U140]|jgi:hypothetical protein|nr:hypothetical protein [Tildeniella nuda ZEHNDER 1965/U140]